MKQYHVCSHHLDWYDCYNKDAKYNRFITPESFAHPAKMSWGLLERIFKHLHELNLITLDTTIVDFMAGTFRTGIMAELFGYKSIGIELEPHFIKMIADNKAQIEKITGRKAQMEFIQSDARRLSELLKEHKYVGVVSPPYACAHISVQGGGNEKLLAGEIDDKSKWASNYADNKNNIGNLPDKQLVGITSPPYENACNATQEYDDKYDLRCPDGFKLGRGSFRGRYSENPDNIGNDNESYLEAMLQVYSQSFKSGISPLVLVTKNPTRNGKLRDLAGDTVSILQQAGYEIFDYHRAILFKEVTQGTLDGESFTKPKGRLSFFKRLSYEKGNVVARWEDIIFARIPDRRGHLMGITSPPYGEAISSTTENQIEKQYQRWLNGKFETNRPDRFSSEKNFGYKAMCISRYSKNPANIGNLPDKPIPNLNHEKL